MKRLVWYLKRQHLGLLALFIALGGTSYAAASLPRNSVGIAQIKTGGVGTAEVKDRSLKAEDFRAGVLTSGPAGPTGAAGAKGDKGDTGLQGPAGPVDSLAVRLRRTSDTQVVPNSATATAMSVIEFSDPTSEQYDLGDFFDPARATTPPEPAGNSVIRIPKAGTYVVTAAARWTANPTGMRSLAINGPQPGGVRVQSNVPASSIASAATAQSVATTERFAEGDLVFASVGQSSGGDLTLDASQNQIHLSAAYVGP